MERRQNQPLRSREQVEWTELVSKTPPLDQRRCAPRGSRWVRPTAGAPDGNRERSTRNVMSGSKTKRRASKSRLRESARTASTTPRWRAKSGGDFVGVPCTQRRARLASCRVASGERSTMGASSSKGTVNTSCITKARRSAGLKVSRTTSRARPTESAKIASSSGPEPCSWFAGCTSACKDTSFRLLRERSAFRQTLATTVVSHPSRFSTSLVSARRRRSHDS